MDQLGQLAQLESTVPTGPTGLQLGQLAARKKEKKKFADASLIYLTCNTIGCRLQPSFETGKAKQLSLAAGRMIYLLYLILSGLFSISASQVGCEAFAGRIEPAHDGARFITGSSSTYVIAIQISATI